MSPTTYQVTVKPGSKQEKVIMDDSSTVVHNFSTFTSQPPSSMLDYPVSATSRRFSTTSRRSAPTTPHLTVYTHAHAHDGAANQAVVQLLAKHFHVSKSRVTILHGHRSKHKLIQVT